MATFDGTASSRKSLISPARILVATDLSDGEFLIPHAIAQAKASHASVVLVHAILPSETIPLDAGAVPYSDWSQTEQEIQSSLTEMATRIEEKGVHCDVAVKHGFAADVVQDQIKSTRATRLIMACHGRGKWGQFVMGSVANQLLGTVDIPVFVVGPRSAHAPEHATPARILHPVSLNGDYRRGVELSIQLAESYGAELTLLHVPDRDVEATLRPEDSERWARNLFATLGPGGPALPAHVHVKVAFGPVVDEIRNTAAHVQADWIVLGVDEGFPFWPLRDSIAYKVVSVANCPVLAIRSEPYLADRARSSKELAMTVIG